MKPIYVTQPLLPPLEEFVPYLERIWENKWLTNGGQFHQQLERALCEYLGVDYLALFTNGTIALVTALQALRVTGEVITTPFSFVATAHSILWNALTPVFVDIEPQTCNLNPDKIEQAITPHTSAIMPVHCYGTPCNVKRIQQIADTYGLKVIYDAAHAFGVNYMGESLLKHGDLSILSFHATKAFNTFEGGAIICPDAKTKQRIDNLKNFGIVDEETVVAPGINGKMNEIQAAFGLLQLKHIDAAFNRRKEIASSYRDLLHNIVGIRCFQCIYDHAPNNSYFPISIESDYPITRDDLYTKFRKENILVRRYFYPLITDFPMYRGLPSSNSTNLPIANEMARKILCLPIYPDLSNEQLLQIVDVIISK